MWTKDLSKTFVQQDAQMANKYMKICSTSLVIRKIEINSTITKMVKIKKDR